MGSFRPLVTQARAIGQLGDPGRGVALLEEGLEIARSLDHAFLIVLVLESLAGMALARGDLETAKALLGEALPLRRTTGDTWGAPYSLAMEGEIAQREGNLAQALERYQKAITLSYDRIDQRFVVGGLVRIGNIAAELGEPESAARLLGAAEKLHETVGSWIHLSGLDRDQRAVEMTRASHGEEAFATAWSAGRALSLHQAVAEAAALAEELVREPGSAPQ